jgi:hypothetical protein
MPDNFDIAEDIAHQHRVWKIERVAWLLMAAAVIASVVGFTGHGLFSAHTVALPGTGIVVEYERFERNHAQTQFSVQLTAPLADETHIHVGQGFLGNVEITRIEPEPSRAEVGVDGATYVFNTKSAGRIIVHYKPDGAGSMSLVIGRDAMPPLLLPQFVYP